MVLNTECPAAQGAVVAGLTLGLVCVCVCDGQGLGLGGRGGLSWGLVPWGGTCSRRAANVLL